MTDPITPLFCVALAVYFEARSEPVDGQMAVAEVILNRVADRRWPDTACGVVAQPDQFSFLWDDIPDVVDDHRAWETAMDVAEDALAGQGFGVNATFYHADYVTPYWADIFTLVGQIGAHRFYEG